MEKNSKKLIMLIGKTHTGKTTFAQNLKKNVPDLLVLEADPIAVFMKETFPELRMADDREHSGVFKDVSLKFKTFLLFVEFALSLNKPIILSNSNMWIKGRELVFALCKKYDYKVIGIYVDLPEELILNRIENSDRSLNILRVSKDFKDLLGNQKNRMQEPNSSDFDSFFIAKSEKDVEDIKANIIELLKN